MAVVIIITDDVLFGVHLGIKVCLRFQHGISVTTLELTGLCMWERMRIYLLFLPIHAS